MTDILSRWATYRQTCHQEYEADTLGDEMAKELERVRALIPLAYGEGILDVSSRGATIENCQDKYETSDVFACLGDALVHESEFPDNYSDATNGYK